MPRIEAENLPEHRRLVHERVFSAFSELMAEQSYDSISMARLAERAGLGRTAIYHHFHDKEAVVIAFATHETERYLTTLNERLATSSDPVEQLRIYIRNHLDLGDGFHMGLGPQLYGVLPESSRTEIREHVVAIEEVLRAILRAGQERGELAFDDLGATTSLIHACLGQRTLPPEAVTGFILHALEA